jgi:hypothetical protein
MRNIFAGLQALIRYASAPAFFALGFANLLLDRSGDPHAGHGGAMAGMASETVQFTSVFEGLLHHPALGSMWLMYFLMGIAHAAPWLPAGGRKCSGEQWP